MEPSFSEFHGDAARSALLDEAKIKSYVDKIPIYLNGHRVYDFMVTFQNNIEKPLEIRKILSQQLRSVLLNPAGTLPVHKVNIATEKGLLHVEYCHNDPDLDAALRNYAYPLVILGPILYRRMGYITGNDGDSIPVDGGNVEVSRFALMVDRKPKPKPVNNHTKAAPKPPQPAPSADAWKCPECNMSTKYLNNMKRHMSARHPDTQAEPIPVNIERPAT